VFKDLFDPIISDRHNGYGPDAKQPTNLDISQISDVDIDPFNKYVLTTRVRTGRSVRGFKLPPVISFEDRRKLEAVAVKGLMTMEGDLKGTTSRSTEAARTRRSQRAWTTRQMRRCGLAGTCSRSRIRRCCWRRGWAATGRTRVVSSATTILICSSG